VPFPWPSSHALQEDADAKSIHNMLISWHQATRESMKVACSVCIRQKCVLVWLCACCVALWSVVWAIRDMNDCRSTIVHVFFSCINAVVVVQVVIAASIIFFQTAASGANIAGTALALSGVLLYSIAKRSKPGTVDVSKVQFSAASHNNVSLVSLCLNLLFSWSD
jgi:hypothetical protein